MKVIFNWLLPMTSRRLGPHLGLCLFMLWVLAGPGDVRAQATYFTPRALLAEFFPKSQLVTYQKFELSAAQRSRVEGLLGYVLKKTSYTLYIAKTGEHVDGYAILDEENGQHLPISFAVKLSPSGAVERQEVMVYRERYGDEVRDPRFRQQFVGKTAADPLRPGEEVIAVSGATISSRAMALGVRRALVLFDELVLRPARDAAAAH